MGSWHDILSEIQRRGSTHDVVRRKYLSNLHEITGRNVIIYYSGWLQKPDAAGTQVNDADKNGFMTVIHQLDRSKGLDLLLHTPGGDLAATESLVDYLHSMFKKDIRVIVPQLAMSAGTMIACAAKEIIMGKHSSLGPIDPQFGPFAAHGIVEEFKQAFEDIRADQTKALIWQPILAKYQPTLVGECEKAIAWSEEMAKSWLVSGMFADNPDAQGRAKQVFEELADHALTKSHARHLSAEKCKSIGLNVSMLEEMPDLQEAVLSVHHSCIHTLSSTPAFKLIENHLGVAYIQIAQTVLVQGSPKLEAS